ncbi:hypothetical protein X907_0555 [Glycocaulis alkaliphilus]|uniref:Uncharacterized protein n=1 Tax=Glycocaulis alkaliphilus TaxID=1434191 RepID=A0A3T0E701_9PROT|nr:class I SAM-dependent methyltransferase [Glycocaulis alkaliphilus]AZU03102.1 hypothetical protein X907_0555 [Glycocaulis alkaliphilus]GGB71003.1 hypothetical protein GCM10007417_08480 [Glycocaulis alkaliphilus]
MTAFERARQRADRFEGMMGPISIGLFEAFLELQLKSGVHGNMVEYGVYRGRSAAVALSKLRASERMMLVDAAVKYPEFVKLKSINPNFDFIEGKSEQLVDDDRLRAFLEAGVRFSHHDASHFYDNVAAEMALMEPFILPRGLMVLDDFGNPSYMQVVAACFHHLARTDCNLEVFLYANNKAYLCRKEDFEFYAGFVLEKMLPRLHAVGLNVYLSRTDNNARYRGFSIALKSKATDDDLYGLSFFGDRFYQL